MAHRPAGGVGPLQGRRQDRQSAFSQDGSEEGESGEGGAAAVLRHLQRWGLRAGGQALAGRKAGGVNEAGSRLKKVPLDADHSRREDAREDRRARRDGAADRGSPRGRPPPIFHVPAFRQDGLPGRGQWWPQVGGVSWAAPVFRHLANRANLDGSVFAASRIHGGSLPSRYAAGRAQRPDNHWGGGFGLEAAHKMQLKYIWPLLGLKFEPVCLFLVHFEFKCVHKLHVHV